jgi:hypothetical protein
MSTLSRRWVEVYDPDTGEYLGRVDVCVHCGEASCGTWVWCPESRKRRGDEA